MKENKQQEKAESVKGAPRSPREAGRQAGLPTFSPNFIRQLADEVAKNLMLSVPAMLNRPRKKKVVKQKKLEYPLFLDTSAIIDRRIFDVVDTGLLNGTVVVPQSILEELKHIADAQDAVKRERGRRGLEYLERLRKNKKMKFIVLQEEEDRRNQKVDERLIAITKRYKGKLITCDYNLEKAAAIQNVRVINVNALANNLKVSAVPGEAVHIKVLHQGKDPTQGVGYLDDGTMVVIEHGSDVIGMTIDVVVSRVIQTATGRILFAKKI